VKWLRNMPASVVLYFFWSGRERVKGFWCELVWLALTLCSHTIQCTVCSCFFCDVIRIIWLYYNNNNNKWIICCTVDCWWILSYCSAIIRCYLLTWCCVLMWYVRLVSALSTVIMAGFCIWVFWCLESLGSSKLVSHLSKLMTAGFLSFCHVPESGTTLKIL